MQAEYPNDRLSFIFKVLSVRCLCTKLQNSSYVSVYQCIGAYATVTWKLSKYGVFYGPYILVFGVNTGKCEPEKNSFFGNFSSCKQRVSIKRMVVLIFRKFINLRYPQLLTR